jgi:hypothetical protein
MLRVRAGRLSARSVRPVWRNVIFNDTLTTLASIAALSCESRSSAAGSRAVCKVREDDDHEQKGKPPHSHQTGVRNGPRSFRFDPGHGGNRGYDDSDAQPYEPVHDSPKYKIRATRARGVMGTG